MNSPTAVALAVAGAVVFVCAVLTGGAAIALAVEAFMVTACLAAPYARGRDDDEPGEDDPPEPEPRPGPRGTRASG